MGIESFSHRVVCMNSFCEWAWLGSMSLGSKGKQDYVTYWRVNNELEAAISQHHREPDVLGLAGHSDFEVYHLNKGGERLIGYIRGNQYLALFRPSLSNQLGCNFPEDHSPRRNL